MRIIPHPLVGVEVHVRELDAKHPKRTRYVWRACQYSERRVMLDVGSRCRPIWVPADWCTRVFDNENGNKPSERIHNVGSVIHTP